MKRERVCDLEVSCLDAPKRIRDVLHQFHLQGVVDRTADREQHSKRILVLVDTAERARVCDRGVNRASHAVGVSRCADTVGEEHSGSGRRGSGDYAINCRSAGHAAAAAGSVRRAFNRVFRARRAEVVCRADFVDVFTQQPVSFHVAQEISREDHSVANFPLDAEVHLDRTRRDVVRSEHVRAFCRVAVQVVANKVAVLRGGVERIGRLQVAFERGNLGCHIPDRQHVTR